VPELASETPVRSRRPVAGASAALASVGVAVPAGSVPSAAIEERLGLADGWIESRTGVRFRRIAEPGERTYEYAARAAADALAAADCAAADVDLIVVATMSHDHLTPAAAALVAAEIGAGRAGALDVNAACSGFVSALGLGAAQIESGRAATVLVIGADLLSHLTDRDDRSTAGLFGDGAGAVLMRGIRGAGRVGPVVLGADGANAGLVWAERREGLIRMNGADTFRHAVARLSAGTLEALEAAGRSLEEVDLFVYHQANSRIIRAVGEQLGLPARRTADYVGRFGNTSAATLPIALALAEEEGRLLGDGEIVLLAAFGAGLTWGATTVRWGTGR
jgi:3-oxoacyl-[acyl-carrier-protein] synthase III